MNQAIGAKKSSSKNKLLVVTMVIATSLFVGAGVALQLVAQPRYDVGGGSMLPNIAPSEALAASTQEPVLGDVVVVRNPGDGRVVVKRLIAVGPATVTIEATGSITVNSSPILRSEGCPDVAWEDALREEREQVSDYRCFTEQHASRRVAVLEQTTPTGDRFSTTLAPGQYFVLGDNRSHSNDSRNPSFGLLSRDAILGVVVGR